MDRISMKVDQPWISLVGSTQGQGCRRSTIYSAKPFLFYFIVKTFRELFLLSIRKGNSCSELNILWRYYFFGDRYLGFWITFTYIKLNGRTRGTRQSMEICQWLTTITHNSPYITRRTHGACPNKPQDYQWNYFRLLTHRRKDGLNFLSPLS